MSQIPLYIDQTGGISIAQLAARARKLKRQKGLGLLVVDYLQLLTGHKRLSDGRVQEVSEITTGLKALAKELNVPIIALSQLSRQVEQRDDKRPQLSDLRESGSIEQDADVVMFVFREEYYVERRKPRRDGCQVRGMDERDGAACTARPRSSSASNAMAPRAPCSWRSKANSRGFPTWSATTRPPTTSANGLVCTAILRYSREAYSASRGDVPCTTFTSARRHTPTPRSRRRASRTCPRGQPASSPSTSRRSRANWRALARHVAPAECAAVVKADAYGLGAERVIPALLDAGCRTFFVATLEEAHGARALAPGAAIFILDGLLARTEKHVANLCAIPVLSSLDEIRAWVSLGAGARRAPPAALQLDTGLNRLGLRAGEVARLARRRRTLAPARARPRHEPPRLCRRGRPSDEPASSSIPSCGCARSSPTRSSLAASDGLMLGPAFHFDLVRPGYALYGGQAAPQRVMPVRPVVRVSARILQVQDVARGRAHRLFGELSRNFTAPRRHHRCWLRRRRVPPRQRNQRCSGRRGADRRQARADRRPRVHGPHHRRRDGPRRACACARRLGRPRWLPSCPSRAWASRAKTIGYEVLTRLGPRFHRVYLDEAN